MKKILKNIKKIVLVIIFLMFSFWVIGQYNSIYYQNFDLSPPPNWWVSKHIDVRAYTNTSNNAGGTSPEAVFDCMYVSTGNNSTNRLYYGPINTSTYSDIKLKWKQNLRHYSSFYIYSIKIETSNNLTNWHSTNWKIDPVTSNISAEDKSLIISNTDVGSSTFYISFTLAGYVYGCDYWFIDNVEILGKPISVVPVELLSFDVSCDDKIHLKWSTATETNNSHFLIQRCNDAINFETFASVNGSGNSNSIINYEYVDNELYKYYRLVQVDYDNTETTFYDKVVSIECEISNIEIFPNPTLDNVKLITDNIGSDFLISDILGNIIYNGKINNTITDIELPKDGVYILQIELNGRIESKKIIKLKK